MSKKKDTDIFAHTSKPVTAWDAAIKDTQKMIEDSKRKIAGLRRSIRTFEELRDSGVPFPSESTNQSEAKP